MSRVPIATPTLDQLAADPECAIPFGKHKGIPLSEVPTDYLVWLVKQSWLREPLAQAVCDEVNKRRCRGCWTKFAETPHECEQLPLREVVDRILRGSRSLPPLRGKR